jgi:hypothetical protein
LPLPFAVAIAIAIAVAVASEIERGFSPASSQPQSGHRSAEGWSEARRAKRLIYCLCFCRCPCVCP